MYLVKNPKRFDLDQILSNLHSRCFEKSWSKDDFCGLFRVNGAIVWVVEENEHLVGFLLARFFAEAGEILSIGLLPEMRRQGAARLLLAALDEEAVAQKVQSLTLEVDEENQAAVSLYLGDGYRVLHRRADYYSHPGGRMSDALLMRKTLV